jgi:MraZ protein
LFENIFVGESGVFDYNAYFYNITKINLAMSTFIGNIEAKVDVKGRVFIPASYRKLLSFPERSVVVMRKDPDNNCLVIYPVNVWEQKLNELKSTLDEWNEQDQLILMQFVSDAEWLDVDAQGRVLIQKKYLQQIGVESDVLFVGSIDRFSVWSKSVYETAKLPSADFARLLREKMSRKSEPLNE